MNSTSPSKWHVFFDVVIAIATLYSLLLFNEINDLAIYHALAVLVAVLMWFSYPDFILSMGYAAHSKSVLWAWVKIVVILFALAFITKTSEEYSRIIIISWILTTATMQILMHIATACLMRKYKKKIRKLSPVLL